jgi:hypothetical protein
MERMENGLPRIGQCHTPMLVSDQMKGKTMTLSETWASIYWAFPDNAFDYLGKPFDMGDGEIKMWNGETQSMSTYVEVPF